MFSVIYANCFGMHIEMLKFKLGNLFWDSFVCENTEKLILKISPKKRVRMGLD